ncbi:MAG TPA: TonB-dependent receptor [Steroidobacteraceae bacterium]
MRIFNKGERSTLSNRENAQSIKLRVAIAGICAASAMHASRSVAADAPASDDTLNEIIVTGSRTTGLRAADSPAPIQLFSADALQKAAGSPDLQNALAALLPSLTLQAYGFDMAGQTLQTRIRGLSPNHVLVLVNGKRRHTTANLAVDTGSPYQGGAGADLNFIPLDSIDHIEVLTDGAAAQYGSDAIAGVINIILKKNNSGGNLNGVYGSYYDTGGKTTGASGNAGFAPTDGSFMSITGEIRNHAHSFSGAIDERVINPAVIGTFPNSNLVDAPNYPYVNRIAGDAESHLKSFLLNTGFDFEGGTELYAFLTYGDKNAKSFENTRLPDKSTYTPPGQATIYQYPFGFNPLENAREQDSQEVLGIKGAFSGWNWDLSSSYGEDKVNIFTLDSTNASLFGATGTSPTDFADGSLRATQWTSNLDINKNFDVGLAGPLNVAFGGEYRLESYDIAAGQPASYVQGGAQSYPGFSPTDAGSHSRSNEAGYVDLAVKPLPGWQVDLAGRYEHYSDFGNATVGKLTTRYDFNSEFALRGTVSNGFRAPTLAEEYYSSTNVGPTSAFVQLPPNSAGAKQLGLNGLQAEHSVNLSLGMVWRPIPGMSMTLDAYQIQVTNRIWGSGSLYGTNNGAVVSPAVNAAIAANGNQLDPDVVATGTTGIQIFANGIDTMTRGVDLVWDYPQTYDFGKIDYSVGATYNKTTITKLPSGLPAVPDQPLYDQEAVSDLTTANPLYTINLGLLWTFNKLSVNLVEKIYGPTSEYQGSVHTVGNVLTYYKTTIGATPITNLDISYQIMEKLSFSIGATNLFNQFPDKINAEQLAGWSNFTYGGNASSQKYPIWSPFGINGGFYYVKASFKW